MQQLWLAHQRIDSIAQLRRLMKTVPEDSEELEGLCVRVVSYHKSGVLNAWLSRQEETADVFGDEKLKKAISELMGGTRAAKPSAFSAGAEQPTPEEKLHRALAELCGVPAKYFAAEEVTRTLDAREAAKREKLQQLKRQAWWNSYEDLFSAVKDEEWAYVVLNQSQLNQALEQLRENHGDVQRTLYLCGSDEMAGKWYSLNLLNLENVKIRGIADPRVQYARMSEHLMVDAAKQRISLQDFVMYFYKQECVVSYEKNAVNYAQHMR